MRHRPARARSCGSSAYSGGGAGSAYRSYVWFDATGNRVAVLLLNTDVVDGAAAALSLYCGA